MSCYECGPTNLTENVKWIHQKKKHENSSVHEEQDKEKDFVVVFEGAVSTQIISRSQCLCAITESHDVPRNFRIL